MLQSNSPIFFISFHYLSFFSHRSLMKKRRNGCKWPGTEDRATPKGQMAVWGTNDRVGIVNTADFGKVVYLFMII